MKPKMATQEKASELVQDLGLNHAIYVTEEIITILKDWEGTELAQKDWVEIKEIIRSLEPLTFKFLNK
jgi:sulfite reductase beta subunit-like hemoprotein